MAIKILLADDSITIQKVVGIIFGGDEYALTVVDNGRDAVAKAAEILPDILLIDAVMPEMSGYDVCRELRSIPPLQDIPILLLTGSFDPVDEDQLKQCGADDFIQKPFESQTIITKISQLCSAKAAAAPAAEPITPQTGAPETPEAPPAAAEPNDIWGAFTAAPSSPTPEPPPAEGAATPHVEPDVFTLVTEDDSLPVNPSPFTAPPALPSEWAALGIDELGLAKDEAVVHAAGPDAVPAQPAAPSPFTEEQLRAAVAAVSKDVIERIVWEVVPDLAEKLIKEAIRKIKEGP